MVKSWPVVLGVVGLLAVSGVSYAAETVQDSKDSPAVSAAISSSSKDIRLTPDTTRIIKLDDDAASVIVTNPNHARVILDSPRTMIVMPRQPGTTPVIVMNAKGETILEKNIIVTAVAKPQYVRIRRMCGSLPAQECQPTSYYYCPDGCYEVTTMDPTQDTTNIPPPQGGGGGGSSNAGGMTPAETSNNLGTGNEPATPDQAPAPETPR